MKAVITKIKNMIYEIRGQKVMIDSDLAALYEVEPKVLNQAVKRNIERFPVDFMFRLTKDEFQEVVTFCDHLQNLKYRPTLPYVLGQDTNAQIAELRKLLMLYIEKNDKRVNDIIVALNNLIEQPKPAKTIGFTANEKSPRYLAENRKKEKTLRRRYS